MKKTVFAALLGALVFSIPQTAGAATTSEALTVEAAPRYVKVVVAGRHYLVRDGVFHVRRGRKVVAVKAPVGAVITSMPRGATVVRRHGVRYYRVGNTYYRPRVVKGATAFVVVRF